MIGLLIALTATGLADRENASDRTFGRVVACGRIVDQMERLACFDREVAAFNAAVRSREVVVLDQEQVKQNQRSLFGFPVPPLKTLNSRRDDQGKVGSLELGRIETLVRSASRMADGRMAFMVEDGARWVQDDDRTLMLARVKPGSKVTISRASLGSYFATFEGGGAAKVRRER